MDLIERQDAIEHFIALWDCIDEIMDKEEWEDVCKTTANELPSAGPKRGKWINDTYCSECGWINIVDSGFICSVNHYNFCPNCGNYNGGKEG